MNINRLQLIFRFRPGGRPLLALCLLLLAPLTSLAQIDDIDTTQIRDPEPVKKDFGHHLVRLPIYILQSPVWIAEQGTHLLVEDAYGGVVKPVLSKLMTTEYRVWGAYPMIGYNNNAGLKVGGQFQSRGVFSEGEKLRLRAYYSTNEYQAYRLKYLAPNLLWAHRGVTLRAEYNKKTRQSFYGLGPFSEESDQVNYESEEILLDGGALWLLSQTLQLHVTGGYLATNIADGDDKDEIHTLDSIRATLNLKPEDVRSTRLLTATTSLIHDNRDSEGRTTRGGYRQLTAEYFHGVGRSDGIGFWRTRLDLRQYWELFHYRVFAMRLVAQETDAADGHSTVPFYLKSGLGGYETLRGYRNHRFVNNDFALAQLEYRWPLLDLLDAFIFFEEGRVFSDLNRQFTFRHWQYSTGGGLQVIGTGDVTATLMLAVGGEEPRYYLEFSETF